MSKLISVEGDGHSCHRPSSNQETNQTHDNNLTSVFWFSATYRDSNAQCRLSYRCLPCLASVIIRSIIICFGLSPGLFSLRLFVRQQRVYSNRSRKLEISTSPTKAMLREVGNYLIHRRLSKTKSKGSWSEPGSQVGSMYQIHLHCFYYLLIYQIFIQHPFNVYGPTRGPSLRLFSNTFITSSFDLCSVDFIHSFAGLHFEIYGAVRQGRVWQSMVGQSSAGQCRLWQHRVGQVRLGQGGAGQDRHSSIARVGQVTFWQDRVGQVQYRVQGYDRSAQSREGQRKIYQGRVE